ncbi:hypothetical protein IAU60_006763 [Kwoniella sp. DSM 27419]
MSKDDYEKDIGAEAYTRDVDVPQLTTQPVENDVDVHTGLRDGVQRNLRQRHVQMMALAGTIGTGLFLGAGKAIAQSGPAGALLAYITIGTVVWSMINSLGELMCFAPISGGHVHFVERFVHPSAGFAMGWMQWYSNVVNLPLEVIACNILVGFWTEMNTAKTAGFIVLFSTLSVSINFFGVRWFGESEFFFAMIKILLIVGLIIGGLIVDLGGSPSGDRIGFRYWKTPGAFAPSMVEGNTGKFVGWFSTLVSAAYSFSSSETIAMTGGELQNPRANAASAVRKLFWRILWFYILGVLVAGMLVPYDDESLLRSTGDAAQSPFVIAFTRAGISGLPSVINAAVLTSAWSATNTALYMASRTLYGLALRGQAPRYFARTTPGGLPLPAICLSALPILLAFMSLQEEANTVLNWLTYLTGVASFITWGLICLAFLRWKSAMAVQGRDRSATKYLYIRSQPLPAYWGIFWCLIMIFGNGFYVFMSGQWDVSNFIISYPLFAALFGIHWFVTGRKRFPRASEIDLVSNVPGPEVDYDPNPPTTRMGRFWNWLL